MTVGAKFTSVADTAIPTPGAGQVTLFTDSADKKIKIKDDAALVTDLTQGAEAPLVLTLDDANNATVSTILTLSKTTSGVPGDGIGGTISFKAEDDNGDNHELGTISGILEDVTDTTESGAFVFKTSSAGAALSEVLKVNDRVVMMGGTFEIGSTDAFSRTQIWNKATNAILRLGSSTGDGDASNVAGDGIAIYGTNLAGDAMSSNDLGYARVKKNRFALHSQKLAGANIDYFRVDNSRLKITDDSGNIFFEVNRATESVIVGAAALATTATDGFLYIPTAAGVPTGVPTAKTGRVPMVYDTTNNDFYIYNGAWKKIALA